MQALVLLVLVAMYAPLAVDQSLHVPDAVSRGPGEIRDFAGVLAVVPVVYAAAIFGMEGAVLTSLWIVFLLVPHFLFPLSTGRGGLIDVGASLGSLTGALLLAGRIRGERHARWRAEAMSERLRLLHGLGGTLRQPRSASELLQAFVDMLCQGMDLDYAALSIRADGGADPELVESGDHALCVLLDGTGTLASAPSDVAACADTGVFPLTGEHRSFGVLGVVTRDRSISQDEREILAVASLEASSSLEVLRVEQMRREALSHYARQVTNAQEEERTRIARDLHDGVVQDLAGLVRVIDLAGVDARRGGSVGPRALEEMRAVASETLAELRRVTRDLRPTTLDRLGLLAALRSLAAETSERSALTVDVQVGEGRPLPPEQELCIYRIVQEALSNVEKHAAAASASVHIRSTDCAVRVDVCDDGMGYAPPEDTAELARRGCFGVLGMTERAALVGGRLEIARRRTGGTRVTLDVSIPREDGVTSAPERARRAS